MSMLPNSWSCFVINLARSTGRLASISYQLRRAGISFHRFEAVDGSTIDPNNCQAFDRRRYEQRHGKEPAPNEIGCFMSHLGVMEAFLRSDAERCLILEDDAIVGASLTNLLYHLEAEKNEWDIVLLYGNHSGAPLRLRPLGSTHHLAGFFFRQTGAVAYVINRKAAHIYLANLMPMTLPIDADYDRAWDFSIRFRGVLPFPIKTGRQPSEIGMTGRKFVWYRRVGTYLRRMRHALRRLVHYTISDPIWLEAAKLRLLQISTRCMQPRSAPKEIANTNPEASPP